MYTIAFVVAINLWPWEPCFWTSSSKFLKLVLYAVYKPALPLAMTLILGIFALYIFAFSYFQHGATSLCGDIAWVMTVSTTRLLPDCMTSGAAIK